MSLMVQYCRCMPMLPASIVRECIFRSLPSSFCPRSSRSWAIWLSGQERALAVSHGASNANRAPQAKQPVAAAAAAAVGQEQEQVQAPLDVLRPAWVVAVMLEEEKVVGHVREASGASSESGVRQLGILGLVLLVLSNA